MKQQQDHCLLLYDFLWFTSSKLLHDVKVIQKVVQNIEGWWIHSSYPDACACRRFYFCQPTTNNVV